MKVVDHIVRILILIGAINWGLWGFFQFDFVAWLFGGDATVIARVIYVLIGLAGLWRLIFISKCKCIRSSCCKSSDKK